MLEKYDKCIAWWEDIFAEESVNVPTSRSSGNEALDKGIFWVCEDMETILDFGCGDGTMLFLCALNGTKHHIGIDLSGKAIRVAKDRAAQMQAGEFHFLQGSIEVLKKIATASVDAVILSNILDNLYPEDGVMLFEEVQRILKEDGKILVKLNPYITSAQIIEWDIKVIKDNLLDDGLILLNHTTEEWEDIFKKYFEVANYMEVYFPEYEQMNRMFFLRRGKR